MRTAPRRRLLLATALVALSGCSGTTGESATVAGGDALVWGDGPHGVVLAHGASYDAASWEDQAVALAEAGATVVAVEELDTAALSAAADRLRADGVERVALVGASAGADAVLAAVVEEPELADQLVLLSANQVRDGLGPEPKLLVANEDEPVADVSRDLARTSPGQENELILLPGAAHAQGIFETAEGDRVLDAIIARVAGAPR